MKKAIFAALAVLGLSVGASAIAPVANAQTSPFTQNQGNGENR